MQKKGATNPLIWVVIILAVGFLLYQQGVFAPAEKVKEADLPSDLQTTVELSFKDALATTETNAGSVLWYLFNGDGSFYDSGTAASGAASVTTRVNRDYTLYGYTTTEGGYIAKKTEFNTGSDPKKSLTIKMIKRSGLEVSALDDPIDLNQNISGTLGATEEVRVKWKCNVSNAGSMAPILVLETNGTAYGVEDVTMTKTDTGGGKWTKITCPDRKSPSATNQKLYCFKRDTYAYASDGVIISYVSIKFDDTVTVGGGDSAAYLQAQLIDTGMYLESGYDSLSGVLFGAEDDADADVGAGDSATSKSYFSD